MLFIGLVESFTWSYYYCIDGTFFHEIDSWIDAGLVKSKSGQAKIRRVWCIIFLVYNVPGLLRTLMRRG